jgi:hypothetical protein
MTTVLEMNMDKAMLARDITNVISGVQDEIEPKALDQAETVWSRVSLSTACSTNYRPNAGPKLVDSKSSIW